MKKAILVLIALGLIAAGPAMAAKRGFIPVHGATMVGPQLFTFYYPPVLIPGPNGTILLPGSAVAEAIYGNATATGTTDNKKAAGTAAKETGKESKKSKKK